MLLLFLKRKGNISEKQFYNQNYTCILDSKCTSLITYINQNINIYLNAVFFELKEQQNESSDSLINLLKNKNISDKNKERILEKCSSQIDNLIDIPVDLIHTVFQKNAIIPTWENVNEYFLICESEINDILITYLEINAQELSQNEVNIETPHNLFEKIIYSTIPIRAFKKLEEANKTRYSNLKISAIKNKQILDELITVGSIGFNIDIYKEIKKNHPNLHIKYLLHFTENFTENLISTIPLLTNDDLILLLQQSSRKKEIIQIISKNNLFKNGQQVLADEIMKNQKSPYFELSNLAFIKFLLENSDNEKYLSKKINIIIKSIEQYNIKEILELIKLLPYKYSKISEGKYPILENTKINNVFAHKIKEKGIVNKIIPQKNGDIKLTVRRSSVN